MIYLFGLPNDNKSEVVYVSAPINIQKRGKLVQKVIMQIVVVKRTFSGYGGGFKLSRLNQENIINLEFFSLFLKKTILTLIY